MLRGHRPATRATLRTGETRETPWIGETPATAGATTAAAATIGERCMAAAITAGTGTRTGATGAIA